MPNFSWILSLEPMTAIIIVVVMGVSFAIVVGLRLKYQYSVINELKEAINKANERISEIHTENEVNKTNIKWLKNPLNKPSD
jgi:cell division protein FtsB